MVLEVVIDWRAVMSKFFNSVLSWTPLGVSFGLTVDMVDESGLKLFIGIVLILAGVFLHRHLQKNIDYSMGIFDGVIETVNNLLIEIGERGVECESPEGDGGFLVFCPHEVESDGCLFSSNDDTTKVISNITDLKEEV